MQKTYNNTEFHKFLIYYVRDYLLHQNSENNNSYYDKDEYAEDESQWIYFINLLLQRGVLSQLLSLKSHDDLNIYADMKIIRNNLEHDNTIKIQS